MEYATLGKTDIKVSRVCIGGMSFGKVFPDFHQWVIDQPATQAVLKRVGKMIVVNSTIGSHINKERPWADWNEKTSVSFRPALFGNEKTNEFWLGEYGSK